MAEGPTTILIKLVRLANETKFIHTPYLWLSSLLSAAWSADCPVSLPSFS
jgi:hypothetical protein